MSEHIHPVFDQLLNRAFKENQLKQKAKVIWLTGLSGSGKTTLAQHLEKMLSQNHFFVKVLDGDNIRSGINNNLGFSDADRAENIRRIAEISKLFIEAGIITICCFVSPTKAIRHTAKNIIGENDFIEVFVDAPLEICQQRDVKGLYEKARNGKIKDFTGIHQVFESPEHPDLHLLTHQLSIEEAVNQIYKFLLPHIQV